MNMTALEMAQKYKWANVTVSLDFGSGHCGHITVEGQVRIVEGYGTTVRVGTLALYHNTIVSVNEEIGSDGARVDVYRRAGSPSMPVRLVFRKVPCRIKP